MKYMGNIFVKRSNVQRKYVAKILEQIKLKNFILFAWHNWKEWQLKFRLENKFSENSRKLLEWIKLQQSLRTKKS